VKGRGSGYKIIKKTCISLNYS